MYFFQVLKICPCTLSVHWKRGLDLTNYRRLKYIQIHMSAPTDFANTSVLWTYTSQTLKFCNPFFCTSVHFALLPLPSWSFPRVVLVLFNHHRQFPEITCLVHQALADAFQLQQSMTICTFALTMLNAFAGLHLSCSVIEPTPWSHMLGLLGIGKCISFAYISEIFAPGTEEFFKMSYLRALLPNKLTLGVSFRQPFWRCLARLA